MLCDRCKKNIAVVFVTKLEDGEQKNEGLCLVCAKNMGIAPLDNMMKNMGIDEEQFNALSEEMMNGEIEITPDMLQDTMGMMKELIGAPQDKMDNEDEEPVASPVDGKAKTKTKQNNKKKRMIDQYGTNLTQKARDGQIDRVIGRGMEIERVTQILNRRGKNNPVLIGEPGVGKTAIAEGLAVRIVEGNVPYKLLNKEIYLLDFAAIVAGTQFRGQFESRLKGILDEARDAGNIIFVIDEVHNIVAAGDAEGAMGAANILKPALVKGAIQVIGATTLDEYRKHIEKDSALERRFQPVMVEEPSVEDTIEIIKGIKDYYEKHHRVKIDDEVIRVATVLAQRYISNRFLPDKAIDVIDEAGSRVNLNNKNLVALEKLKLELQKVLEEKENAVEADSIEAYQKAADLKINECKLREEIDKLEKICEDTYITVDDVSAVIEMWTKIPVKRIGEFESDKLLNLESRLHERLIGQEEAVNAVARTIRVNRAGLSAKKRPVSFIFVGPTGVGKTELVRQVARELFDDEKSLIRLDMSEYMEKHAVSKIIGSPPGYVGYDDAGQLTEKVRRHPYSVILLDEIEKAHPDVFNILLQVLDDGRITDSQGRVVSFENCVIFMTSNAGSDLRSSTMGFGSVKEGNKNKIEAALKNIFRPEFLNRVDEVIIFDVLTKEQLVQICTLMLSDLANGIKEKGITVEFADELKQHIVEKGFDDKYGARPMRRLILKEVEAKIAEMFIENKVVKGDKITVTFDGEVKVIK